jgi:dTDP-glucose 4,6-dehydratase
VAERLVRDGFTVRAMVQYNSFGHHGWLDFLSPQVQDALEFFAADIRDPFRLRAAVTDTDCILHLASLVAIPYSYQAARSYVSTNVTGTLNLLQAARDQSVARFVHTSTSEVYGTAQYVPIDEHHPLVGQSPYAASKIGADQMALSFYRSFDLPVTVIRPFNAFGPRQSARAIIPTIICQLAAGTSELKLGNLAPTRDFTFVEDIAAAFVAFATADGIVGETINIGSGREISVGQLAESLIRLMNSGAVVTTVPERLRPKTSEVDRLLCDNSKAGRLLGWKPTVDLEDGLKRTIDWFTTNENLRGYHPGRYQV